MGLLLAILAAAGAAPVTAEGAPAAVQAPLQPDSAAADCRAIDPAGLDPAKISGDASAADRMAIEATARARYLRGDLGGALDALNQLDKPRVRCLNVDGLVRTDRRVKVLMTQSPWLDAGGEDSFPELLWEDGERRFCRIWRSDVDSARSACLAVRPAGPVVPVVCTDTP